MPKVFISYAREDRDYAHSLAEALTAKGYDVWWDHNLIGGTNYRASIRQQLQAADKVIVLWSANSAASSFVIDEAGLARDGGKLVPLSIDGTSPPLGFGDLHTLAIDDFGEDIGVISAALDGRAVPAGFSLDASRRGKRSWVGIVIGTVVLIAAGVAAFQYLTISKVETPGATSAEATAAAKREYEIVQAIYGNIKNLNMTCSGVQRLVKQLSQYQGSTKLVPKDKAYSVFQLGKRENPTIGDLAVDRMTRMRRTRPDCFR